MHILLNEKQKRRVYIKFGLKINEVKIRKNQSKIIKKKTGLGERKKMDQQKTNSFLEKKKNKKSIEIPKKMSKTYLNQKKLYKIKGRSKKLIFTFKKKQLRVLQGLTTAEYFANEYT